MHFRPRFSASFRHAICASRAALFVAAVVCIVGPAARSARADKWALLIGIDSYKDSAHINNLGSAAADARAIRKALAEAEHVPEANIRLLVSDANPNLPDLEAKPERNMILRELSNLAKRVQPGDTVYVFFSGHGIEKNGVSYLLPYDTDALDSDTTADTAIDTAKFRERLQAVHAGLLVLAFDMCRNNPVKGSRDVVGNGNALTSSQVRGLDFAVLSANGGSAPVTAADGPRAVVTLFSCSPNERSYEWIGKGRGYFSWFLEQGLRGAEGAAAPDGAVHVDTLTRYVSQNVLETVNREEKKTQTPFVEIKGQIEASHITLMTPGLNSAPPAPGLPSLAADPRAYLKLSLTPDDATVLIDGVRQYPVAGRIAVPLEGQASKSVEVGITAPGYQASVNTVMLTRGTLAPLSVVLSRLPNTPTAPSPNGADAAVNPVAINVSMDFDDAPDTVLPAAVDLKFDLTPASVQSAMKKVADWQLVRAESSFDRQWTYGVLYEGLLAASQATGDPRYHDAVLAAGKKFAWTVVRPTSNADNQCVTQTYLDLYVETRNPAMLAPTRAAFDAEIASPTDARGRSPWWWIDTLYMAPAAWARLSKATGDTKYLDFLDREWWNTSRDLYDTNEHLYFRDISFIPKREANGKKVFWSRGNGWLMAGIARTLPYLPVDYPNRPAYIARFKEMASRIVELQGTDGLWRSGMLDPDAYKLPEISGSALFTYALAWGINEGLLDRASYQPIVARAWKGMLSHIYADGRLGCIQPSGIRPARFKPTSCYVYGVGAYLLAGAEVNRLAGNAVKANP